MTDPFVPTAILGENVSLHPLPVAETFFFKVQIWATKTLDGILSFSGGLPREPGSLAFFRFAEKQQTRLYWDPPEQQMMQHGELKQLGKVAAMATLWTTGD